MTPDIAEVERALLALPQHERAAVIHTGLLSLDGEAEDDAESEQLWIDEVRARLNDVRDDRVVLGTFASTFERFAAGHPLAE